MISQSIGFKSPVSDDDDLLCYEGVIDNKKVLFIDCKKSVDSKLIKGNHTTSGPVGYNSKSFGCYFITGNCY